MARRACRLACQSNGLLIRTGRPDGDAFWPLPGVLRCVLIRGGERQTWCGQVRDVASGRAGERQGKAAADQRKRNDSNHQHGHCQLGGRSDDLTGLRAGTLPSLTRKTGPTMKKEAENPICELSAFCSGSGTWVPCPYCHALIPCPRCQGHCLENRSFLP